MIPRTIIKHDATGVSYPTASELNERVGLNEMKKEAGIASQAILVLETFLVKKYVA